MKAAIVTDACAIDQVGHILVLLECNHFCRTIHSFISLTCLGKCTDIWHKLPNCPIGPMYLIRLIRYIGPIKTIWKGLSYRPYVPNNTYKIHSAYKDNFEKFVL